MNNSNNNDDNENENANANANAGGECYNDTITNKSERESTSTYTVARGNVNGDDDDVGDGNGNGNNAGIEHYNVPGSDTDGDDGRLEGYNGADADADEDMDEGEGEEEEEEEEEAGIMSTSSVASSSIGEENNENLPGMDVGFQLLEERIVAERTATCTTTQLLRAPSIIDIIGCDITVDDIQLAKKELKNQKIDLKDNVNKNQHFSTHHGRPVAPMIHFCRTGNLLIVRLLFLIGADCTKEDEFGNWFPMLAASQGGHLDICKWLFEYGEGAKNQINKETSVGDTPLRAAYHAWYWAWYWGRDKEGNTCRWLLRNGGGQHLSSRAMHELQITDEKEEWNSNLLILWMREKIQLYDSFILLLCGATTMITSSSSAASSSSSEPNDSGTHKNKRQRLNQERSLQILDNNPGVMELIGDYIGLIRGKEFRMLEEFNELVIEYENTDESSSDGIDDNVEDY